MTPEQIQSWLNLGVGGIITAALFLGYKRVWTWGWYTAAVEKERDEWKAMALDGLKTAGDMAQASKQHTTLTSEEADEALRIIREAGRRERASH